MVDVLADNPVLTLFLVVGLGSALGLVPFGPIRFGPAGALFVGLALGAMDDRLGQDLGLARTIGLALFVYTVGLSSGSILIRTFRRQLPLMAGSALVLVVVGVGTVLLGRLLALSGAFQGGVFAGVGTSTPTLAAATAAAGGGAVVEPGDQVVVVGPEDPVARAVDWLGKRADEHLAHDRRQVDYRRVLLSNSRLAGATVADLDIGGRFGGVVTRVRRGDLDLLARDDLHVLPGDRLRVVVPRGRMGEVTRYLGDTERRVSEVDAVSLGLGLTLGFLLGCCRCRWARSPCRSGSRPGRWWRASCSAGWSGPGRSSGASPPGPA